MTDKMRIVTIALAAALVGAGLMAGFYVIGSVGATASPTTQTRTYSGTGDAEILETDKIASGNYTLTFTANNYARVALYGENEWEEDSESMGTWNAPTGGSENITKGFVFWDGPHQIWDWLPYDFYHLPAGELFIEVTTQPAAEWTLTIALESPADNSESADPTPAPTLTPTATPTPAPTPTIRPTNTPAHGTPTISGSTVVGQTLSASTAGIVDADGLTDAQFSYQWLSSRDTEIDSATSSTYTLTASDAGKTMRVIVSFDDDAGNAENVTSDATAMVQAALTGSIHSQPANHSGSGNSNRFTFRLEFSEPVSTSFRTLRDSAFTVTNGSIKQASRVDGRSDLWEITVQPSSNAAVTVVLQATTLCSNIGAVCTRDGRPLSAQAEATVPGPNI